MKKALLAIIVSLVLLGCTIPSQEVIVEAGKPIEVYFCPRDNCESKVVSLVDEAKLSIYCAFFDLDLEKLINALDRKSRSIDVRLVLDSDNYFKQTKGIPFVLDDKNQLSHNKFCVIDGNIVLTGSFNPTDNGNELNNNNILPFFSK